MTPRSHWTQKSDGEKSWILYDSPKSTPQFGFFFEMMPKQTHIFKIYPRSSKRFPFVNYTYQPFGYFYTVAIFTTAKIMASQPTPP